ncbi:MAG: hypothetical protein M1827_001042 [Pycnora praestabilis]|nr:MAG: hypothetical protein M1827_001042 [Pycnora praestabilis]
MSQHSEILIVGAGIFGISTAYHLSLTHPHPQSITILDRGPYPSSPAASTDINKIIRADYSSAFYMSLAYEAIDAWSTWPVFKKHRINDNDENQYHRTGWVMLDEEGSDLAERIRKNFRQSGREDPTESLDLEEVRRRWAGLLNETDLKGFRDGYWNPLAGWAEAADADAALMEEAIQNGVKYTVGEAERVVIGKHGVMGVRTRDRKVYTADKVVLATGAWTSQIMSVMEDELGMEQEDRIERQVTAAGVCVAHYKLEDEEMERLGQMPVVVYGENGEVLPPTKERLLKFTNANTFTNTITTPSGHRISVPPDRDQRLVSENLKQETLRIIIKRVMPQFADRHVDFWRLCWDSITPSQNQLLTQHPHPSLRDLYLAIGGSFHSYKFLPIIGKYMARVLDGKSNGVEKDRAWAWKSVGWPEGERGAHEKVIPQRDLKDVEGRIESLATSKL